MALEISEIGVHLAVAADGPGSDETLAPAEGAAMTAAQHQAIVNACVQQVLRSLRQAEER